MGLDGTWGLEVSAPDGLTYKPTLVVADGGATGSVTDPTGAPVAFSGGAVGSEAAKFTVNMQNPAPLALVFDVKASGDAMTGTVTSPLGVAQLKGARVA